MVDELISSGRYLRAVFVSLLSSVFVFCYYVSDTTHVRLQKASKLYSLSWVWPAGLTGWLAHRHLLNEFSNLLIAARVVNERIESSEQSSKSSTSGCSISLVGYVWYHRILQCTVITIAVDHACVSFFNFE